MATLKRTRAAQWPMTASFAFNIADADAMLNASGVLTNLKAATGVFDVIPLPAGTRVVGGELIVEVVSNDTGTATLSVGDATSAVRYLGATTLKTAARTALVPTIFVSTGEPIRITLANANGDATTGKVRLNVTFVKDGKEDQVFTTSQVLL
jgi:hypothetical protein